MLARPTLADSLFCGELPRYLASRLRPLLVYRMLGLLAHLTEFFFLRRVFPMRSLLGTLAVSNLCLIASAFFWAALEPVRERVRLLPARADATALANPFLSLALALGAITTGASLVSLGISDATDLPRIALLYTASALLRLSLDLVLRALQIPIAAHSRIWRPQIFLLLRPVLGPLALLASWNLLGGSALPLAVAVSSLLQFAVVAIFTLRTYRLRRLPWPRPHLRQLLPSAWGQRSVRTHLIAGCAGALPMTASLLIPALVVSGHAQTGHRDALLILHALVPLLGLAGGWAQVFYVDLHWLLQPWRAALLRRFERALEFTAPALAAALLPWISFVAWLLNHHSFLRWALACAPLLAAQAWLSSLQLRLLVRGKFGALALAALVQMLGIAIATFIASRLTTLRGIDEAQLCTAIDLLVVVALRRKLSTMPARTLLEARAMPISGEELGAAPLPLLVWCRDLAGEQKQLRVGTGLLGHSTRARLHAVTMRLEQLLGAPGCVTSPLPGRLLFWTDATRPIAPASLLGIGAGTFAELRWLPLYENGIAALHALEVSGLLLPMKPTAPNELAGDKRDRFSPDSTLAAELITRCPSALPIDLANGIAPPSIRALPRALRKRLFAAAERSARGVPPVAERGPYAVVAESCAGVLLTATLVPRTVAPEIRRDLRFMVESRTLRRSIAAGLING